MKKVIFGKKNAIQCYFSGFYDDQVIKYLSSYQENVQWELSKSLFLIEKRRVANIGLHDNVTINEDFACITIKRRKFFCYFTDFPNCFPVRFVYFHFFLSIDSGEKVSDAVTLLLAQIV